MRKAEPAFRPLPHAGCPSLQEWPRFSEEPFRRWLLPDWRAQFAGLWHGYYMFRNQGQLGAPDPAMHVTLTLEGVAPEGDNADWMYVVRGTGDDGMGPFAIEGTIRPVRDGRRTGFCWLTMKWLAVIPMTVICRCVFLRRMRASEQFQ